MNPQAILCPVFSMFVLTMLVLLRLAWLRNKAVMQKKISIKYFQLSQGDGEQTPQMITTSRNYINLLESPVLFYVVVILFYVTGRVDATAVGLAWAYVLSRVLHSIIHMTANDVQFRFAAFALSLVCLVGLWVKLGMAL